MVEIIFYIIGFISGLFFNGVLFKESIVKIKNDKKIKKIMNKNKVESIKFKHEKTM